MFEAVILAGGFGTRLQEVLKEVPKAMAPVNGRPFLEYLLDYLVVNGIRKVVLSVGHHSTMIMEHFGSEYLGMKIDYALEKRPLGTGGGIRLALDKCQGENILALNGDTLFLLDLKNFHKQHKGRKKPISIALRRVGDVSRYGSVRIDENQQIFSFGEKSAAKLPGLINAGVYLINKSYFLEATTPGSFSIEEDLFVKLAQNGFLTGIPYDAYFLDIGIPKDYFRAQDEFKKLIY